MIVNRPRRSALYMPGSNARALEKAKTLAADAVILDLEDSVTPEEKVDARHRVVDAVRAGGFGRREVVIRVNGVDTEWGEDDLLAAIDAGPDAVLLPKVATPEDILRVRASIANANAASSLTIWAMIETPLAILNVQSIALAAASETAPVTAFLMGTNDLAKERRAALSDDRIAVIPWLMHALAAARAYGLDILDGVYNSFRDEEGFAKECAEGRMLGMDGKTLIHPSQIEVANSTFAPEDDDVIMARKIIAAFERPENADKGVITLEGTMVERLHAEMAVRTVAIADAIAQAADA